MWLGSPSRFSHTHQVGAGLPEIGCHISAIGELVGRLGFAVGKELAGAAVHVG